MLFMRYSDNPMKDLAHMSFVRGVKSLRWGSRCSKCSACFKQDKFSVAVGKTIPKKSKSSYRIFRA